MKARVGFLVGGLVTLVLVGCSEKQKAAARLEAAMKMGDTSFSSTEKLTEDTTRLGKLDSAVAEITARVSVPGVVDSAGETIDGRAASDSIRPRAIESTQVSRETSNAAPDAGAIPDEEQIKNGRSTQSVATPEPPPQNNAPTDTAKPPLTQQTNGSFVVQVISTPDEREANALASRLGKGGFSAFVTDVFIDGTTYFRVRVGRFATSADADEALTKLHEQFNVSGFVTQVK